MNTMDNRQLSGVVHLPSACTIKNIGEIMHDTLSVARSGGKIILDGSNVTSVDFSFVQLVVSAVATVGAAPAAFELRDPAPCIGTAFARAGLAGFVGIASEV